MRFIIAYIKSMRLYYSFVTGIAGWIGLAFYEYIASSQNTSVEIIPSISKQIVILTLLFLSWGINQIVNDYLGLKEDRINAPQRPMVTGELNPKKALMVSASLMFFSIFITVIYLQPIAIIPALFGSILNIIYEYAKGYGILGNIVFGLMIAMCTVFGFLAAGPIAPPYFTPGQISIVLMVAVINGIMTFYTFFKDYKGDRAAKKNTLVVQFGLRNSRIIALGAAFLPAAIFAILSFLGYINPANNPAFILLGGLALILQLWTGYLYFRYPFGSRTYYSLSANFKACTCGQAAIISLFNTQLSAVLFLSSYLLVGFLFSLHPNSKA